MAAGRDPLKSSPVAGSRSMETRLDDPALFAAHKISALAPVARPASQSSRSIRCDDGSAPSHAPWIAPNARMTIALVRLRA